jgi:hypothetical protein
VVVPSRLLREGILDSEAVNALSFPAEVFYRRLMSVVDDFGRFDGRPSVLRSRLYPLKVESVREADISRWIAECEKAGLIVLYEHSQKRYLQILDFRQRLDRAKAKFPLPKQPVNDTREIVNDFPREEKGSRKEEKGSAAPDLSNSNLFRQPKIPTKEKVLEVFLNAGGTKEMAEKFFYSNEATGWFYKGSPITNFASMVPGYIASWKGNLSGTTKTDFSWI